MISLSHFLFLDLSFSSLVSPSASLTLPLPVSSAFFFPLCRLLPTATFNPLPLFTLCFSLHPYVFHLSTSVP